MTYGEFVHALGHRYGDERRKQQVEFPYFRGPLTDLVDQAVADALATLQGEYLVFYNAEGVHHLILVYFDLGVYEAEGTPDWDGLRMDSSADEDVDQWP